MSSMVVTSPSSTRPRGRHLSVGASWALERSPHTRHLVPRPSGAAPESEKVNAEADVVACLLWPADSPFGSRASDPPERTNLLCPPFRLVPCPTTATVLSPPCNGLGTPPASRVRITRRSGCRRGAHSRGHRVFVNRRGVSPHIAVASRGPWGDYCQSAAPLGDDHHRGDNRADTQFGCA